MRQELNRGLVDILSARGDELSALAAVSMEIENICLRYNMLHSKAETALAEIVPIKQASAGEAPANA